MSLHERIKEARIKKGLTQEQLGQIIGVAKTTITGYEKNREPSAAKVGEIADALEVDVNFLFQDEIRERHNNNATYDEFENIVKKYRALDQHGKEMVDFTLDKEYERSVALQKEKDNVIPYQIKEPESDYLTVNAAHAIKGAAPEDIQHDKDIMDDDNGWD